YSGDKKEFYGQPLVVIDPVDPKRNVAAALSPGRFVKFVTVCRQLLSKPSENFFVAASVNTKGLASKISKRGTLFFGIKFSRPEESDGKQVIVEDIVYPQLRKTARRLVDILQENDFVCQGSDVWCSEKDCVILLELSVWNLPNVRSVVGPPIFSIKHSEEFLKKYKHGRVWVEGDKWIAEVKRDFISAQEKVKGALSQKAETLKSRGIATHMADSISKGFKLLSTKELVNYKDKDLLRAVKEYFEHEDFVFG
ncbi:MAG TPA: hypothetical protein VJA47_06480, partial [archaeon]|nr:hypothetical protein [archaeon]